MNLDDIADDSCLDPHVSCVKTSHPAARLDVNPEQRSVNQSMMSGPHRGDGAHGSYDVWNVQEVHPAQAIRNRARTVLAGSDGITWQDREGVVRALNIAATVLTHL
jgi:hypothetical protein